MGMRDRFIAAVKKSRDYEEKFANLFDDKIIEKMLLMSEGEIDGLLGKKLMDIGKQSWKNGEEFGKMEASEIMRRKNIRIVKGKKIYLTLAEIIHSHISYIYTLRLSAQFEIQAEISRMIDYGFSVDTASNSVIVARLKNALLNKLKKASIQVNTNIFNFSKIAGMTQ